MWVEAVLSKDDLAALIAQIVPLTIHLHPDSAPDQYLELATATDLALVADQGLRMTTQARIHWPILGIAVPIKIDPLSVIIKPRIASTPAGDALSFALEIEHADFAGIPWFGDQPITDKINSELRKVDVGGWAFTEMLSHRFDLPALLEPLDELALNVAWGKVRVTDEAMVLAISFHAKVARHGDGVVAAPTQNGSPLVLARPPALASRRIFAPNVKQAAFIGGGALALIGAFFTVRGAGRTGAKLIRRALG